MKLPNWFKVAWWIALTGLLTAFLYHRLPALARGDATPADLVISLMWFALLLVPIFGEVSLFGLTLKQHISELKGFVAAQVTEIRGEIRNAVDVRTTISPHFTVPPPATDAQLPQLEARIKSAVSDAMASLGIKSPPPAMPSVDDDVLFLFATRHNLEKQLRRIADSDHTISAARRPPPALSIAHGLAEAGLIEPQLHSAIREVYAICSPAIHGESVTPAQIAFVRDVGPDLISALHAVKRRIYWPSASQE